MMILPYQNNDPFFDDASEWSNTPDMPQQPSPARSSSRFHKRGSTARNSAPTDGMYEIVAPSQPVDGDGFFPPEDSDDAFSVPQDPFGENPDNGYNEYNTENGSDFPFDEFEPEEKHTAKSFAGFFILTALLVVAVCGTFLIKSKLSNEQNRLSADDTLPQTTPAASASLPDTDGEPDTAGSDEPAQAVESVGSAESAESVETQSADATEYQTLKMGSKNADVKKMQERLLALGYIGKESCTGYFGDYTEKIVKRFQKKAGLSETGVADNETLTRLYADDAPRWR